MKKYAAWVEGRREDIKRDTSYELEVDQARQKSPIIFCNLKILKVYENKSGSYLKGIHSSNLMGNDYVK